MIQHFCITLYVCLIELPGLCLCATRRKSKQSEDKLLLNDVPFLKFQRGAVTAARRSDPIMQLECLGSGCQHYRLATGQHIDEVICENAGKNQRGAGRRMLQRDDGDDGDIDNIVWNCNGGRRMQQSGFEITNIEVSCEGYDSEDDPYVLAGSCALEYGLAHSNERDIRDGRIHSRGDGQEMKKSRVEDDEPFTNLLLSPFNFMSRASALYLMSVAATVVWIFCGNHRER